MKRVSITNLTHPLRQPLGAAWCDSFLLRLRGLMFRPTLSTDDGIIIVQPVEDRINAAIHMLFMNFDIGVIWADSSLRVVDTCLARRWRLAYSPAKAARYILETHPDRLPDFSRNDLLAITPCEQ